MQYYTIYLFLSLTALRLTSSSSDKVCEINEDGTKDCRTIAEHMRKYTKEMNENDVRQKLVENVTVAEETSKEETPSPEKLEGDKLPFDIPIPVDGLARREGVKVANIYSTTR